MALHASRRRYRNIQCSMRWYSFEYGGRLNHEKSRHPVGCSTTERGFEKPSNVARPIERPVPLFFTPPKGKCEFRPAWIMLWLMTVLPAEVRVSR
jgi:hypothetical protein